MDELGLALTFDDVRLKTGYSEVMPDDVNLESKFSRNIPLLIPVTSAAMDTVTEADLAMEMAQLGGLGVIHRNMTPEKQADEVARVKFHLNALIEKPIYCSEGDTIASILKRREEKGYNFHTFPVLNNEGKLVGILTETDFDFCENTNLSAKEVMTRQVVTGKPETNIQEAYSLMREGKKKAIPLVDEQGNLAGMYIFSDVERVLSGDFTSYNIDKRGQLRVAAAIGVYDDAYSRLEKLVKENVDVVVIDTAHADSKPVIETLRKIKSKYDVDVVVGNISNPKSVKKLIKAGADGIRIGQGPSAICTTRIIAGVGIPQVTAIYECSEVAKDSGIPVCADGGIRFSGDIPIAIGAGADSIMLGSLLAGTKESPGEIVFRRGRQWKHYRGMGSIEAMEESKESRQRYMQADAGKEQLIAEGIGGLVPYRGELKIVMFQYIGGLRRGMGYVGAANIKELKEKADFWRITRAGVEESHPHGVLIMEEAPNYSGQQDGN